MQITYVGPFAPVDHPAILGVTVAAGETIDVPDALAGAAPSQAWLDALAADSAAQHAIPRVHADCVAARDAVTSLAAEAGSGLLACPELWIPATAAPPPPKPPRSSTQSPASGEKAGD